MERSNEINDLALALSQAQGDFTAVQMDAENPYFKSRYATLGALIEAARPVLAKYGLAVTQLVNAGTDYAGIETVLMHKSGQWIAENCHAGVDGKNTAQAMGAVITYLRRYSYAAILGLYAEEDTDGNKPGGKPEHKSSPQTARPYSPVTLKAKIQEHAKAMQPASEKQVQFLAALFEQELTYSDIRHDAQEYLFGVRSLSDADPKAISAALKWLDPQQQPDGKYMINKFARVELQAVQSEWLKSKGQEEILG